MVLDPFGPVDIHPLFRNLAPMANDFTDLAFGRFDHLFISTLVAKTLSSPKLDEDIAAVLTVFFFHNPLILMDDRRDGHPIRPEHADKNSHD